MSRRPPSSEPHRHADRLYRVLSIGSGYGKHTPPVNGVGCGGGYGIDGDEPMDDYYYPWKHMSTIGVLGKRDYHGNPMPGSEPDLNDRNQTSTFQIFISMTPDNHIDARIGTAEIFPNEDHFAVIHNFYVAAMWAQLFNVHDYEKTYDKKVNFSGTDPRWYINFEPANKDKPLLPLTELAAKIDMQKFGELMVDMADKAGEGDWKLEFREVAPGKLFKITQRGYDEENPVVVHVEGSVKLGPKRSPME